MWVLDDGVGSGRRVSVQDDEFRFGMNEQPHIFVMLNLFQHNCLNSAPCFPEMNSG